MTDKIIIDGWNLAWKIPHIAAEIPGNLERARVQLNLLLKNYFQERKTQFKVIYDGKRGIVQQSGYDRSVDTRFSRDPEKADQLIVKFIHRQKKPAQWTVITSDRELAGRIKGLGAQVVDADVFLEKILNRVPQQKESSSKMEPNLDSRELEFWLRTFKKHR